MYAPATATPPRPPKNRLIALLLAACPFTGVLGIDRFYLGHTTLGIIKLLTLGGFFMWWFFDFMVLSLDAMLYSFGRDTGFIKDGDGRDLVGGLSAYRLEQGRLVPDWFSEKWRTGH